MLTPLQGLRAHAHWRFQLLNWWLRAVRTVPSYSRSVFPAVAGLTSRATYGDREVKLDSPPCPELSMRRFVVTSLLLFPTACASDEDAASRSTTQRERDSVLGTSRLPGARGVRGALGAADSAAARDARIDSIASQP
jgi:hypothetical protein